MYWIKNVNNSTYFTTPRAVKKEECYNLIIGKGHFTTEQMHLLGEALIITTLVDACLDHPIQHEESSSDTRQMATLVQYNPTNDSKSRLNWLMKPKTAMEKTKTQINRLILALSTINRTCNLSSAKLNCQMSE
jgi:hypothetical protein